MSGPLKPITYTYGPGNELLTKGQREFTYDNNGNLNAKTYRKHDGEHRDELPDHDGRQWTYTYGFENRLIKAEIAHDHEKTSVTFKYDPFGRRIEKKFEKIRKHSKTEGSTIHSYVYDGQAVILKYETKPDEGHKDKIETTRIKYFHGPNIDEPLAMTRNNEVYFYHADGLGSNDALSDEKQKAIETNGYDSFGNLKDRDDKPIQPFTYTGREWDTRRLLAAVLGVAGNGAKPGGRLGSSRDAGPGPDASVGGSAWVRM